MKKRVLTTVWCALLSIGLYAQREDYAYCSHIIDSLISVYSVDEYRQPNFYSPFFKEATLNVEEKMKLINKIEIMFEQKRYSNLYALGSSLLDRLAFGQRDNNPPQIRQRLLEIYLQYYFYPGVDTYHQSVVYVYGEEKYKSDYTKKAKKRIVELLENKKTEEEYELWLKREGAIYSTLYPTIWWRDAEKLMQTREEQSDDILTQIRDSLLTESINSSAKRDFESLQIESDLIRMIGVLDMREGIPALNEKIAYCMEQDCFRGQTKACRYALARLGDTKQHQYILDSLMGMDYFDVDSYFDRRDFAYFKDDEMIWKYIEHNYHSHKQISIDSEGGIDASLKTMNDVYPYIKNVPKELEHAILLGTMEEEYHWAKNLYEWLMANKRKVKFDYEGEKEFSW